MVDKEVSDDTIYRVVVNHEEQYSIWPADRECPLGWRDAGKTGAKSECLAHIESVWTDMRPLSLRRQMESPTRTSVISDIVTAGELDDPRDDLVAYLSQGEHPVQATATSAEQFIERVRSGYVNIRFTDTRGGTELGIKLDPAVGDTIGADVEGQKGKVHIAGDLTLKYRQVRLTADLELDTLQGTGRLQPIGAGA
jgi:uncharacterized protein YbdZ (MbtH family)